MEESQLIEKVNSYLLEKKTSFVQGSIEYIGVRNNYEIENGRPRSYHYLSFQVVIDPDDKYSSQAYFIFADVKTEKLVFLIGPNSSKKIESN